MDSIPKKFKLFGTTVNVVFDNKRMDEESTIGLSEWKKSLITLCNKSNGEEINEDVIIDTYYHEKVHTILDSMGEVKLSGNEKFVEVFSKLLRQSDNTAEFYQR